MVRPKLRVPWIRGEFTQRYDGSQEFDTPRMDGNVGQCYCRSFPSTYGSYFANRATKLLSGMLIQRIVQATTERSPSFFRLRPKRIPPTFSIKRVKR